MRSLPIVWIRVCKQSRHLIYYPAPPGIIENEYGCQGEARHDLVWVGIIHQPFIDLNLKIHHLGAMITPRANNVMTMMFVLSRFIVVKRYNYMINIRCTMTTLGNSLYFALCNSHMQVQSWTQSSMLTSVSHIMLVFLSISAGRSLGEGHYQRSL